ncbi:MAG: hypothetical protein Q8K30_00540 [Candidatus Gracilibacteria bacterium]|nr:hypothetical protein [Candidatus Gracilibacteria bacterium]
MKKLFIVFIITFFLGSCSISSVKYLSNKLINNEDNLTLDSASEKNTRKQSSVNSGSLIENTDIGLEEVEESETDNENEGITKVLSIEEQYCKSKGGKVIDEICYATDEIGLIKCNINVFYLDMCRDKTAKIENGIVVSIPGYAKKTQLNNVANQTVKEEKNDEKNKIEGEKENKLKYDLSESIESEDSTNDKEESSKFLVEKNIGNGFIFKEDETNKYLFLNNKLITKLDKSSKLLMNSTKANDKVISFNIYNSKTSSTPSKTLYVDMETNSIIEKNTNEIPTQTANIDPTLKLDSTSTKTQSDSENMINSKTGKSGTYFISGGDLKLKTASGEVKNIFSESGVNIYDYDLMINKQIKVYYKLSDGEKEDKIINIP